MTISVSKFTRGASPAGARAGETSPLSSDSVSPGSFAEAKGVIASIDQIETWLAIAKAGDRFLYATRPFLPAGSQGALRMRTLAEQGLVYLVKKRSDLLPGEWCYYAERSTKSAREVRPLREPRHDVRTVPDDISAINVLLPILKKAARFGRPCPTDVQLAERAQLPRDAVQPAIDAMRTMNIIRVLPAKAPTLRLVEIVETGHKTGLVA
ncbi:conserved hypothetical protein [Sphingomonas aurantiaca]|uniref:Uncharacterized protein n=1 Tax=Sphingomonas aurantiaca TaxID=185949 RepID=A0A5E7ZTI6_9SPHN|nr:hypothetical protein [Sphingomonas aurantiaca]VVT20435.1 conserved hypothetical protein [Sphingomonas aurantiaca]